MKKTIEFPPQEWLGYDPERGNIHGYTFDQRHEIVSIVIQECIDTLDFHGFDEAIPYVEYMFKSKFGADVLKKEIEESAKSTKDSKNKYRRMSELEELRIVYAECNRQRNELMVKLKTQREKIIEELKNKKNSGYTDIISDGGLDPR